MKTLFLCGVITASLVCRSGFCFANETRIPDLEKGSVSTIHHEPPISKEVRSAENRSYSLCELLENVPEIYVSSIKTALTVMAPKQKVETIRFSPLLGGLSTSRMFRTEIDGKGCVFRLLDPKRAIEKRQSEIDGLRIGGRLEIAPKLIYANEAALVIVLEFIEGRTFSHEDLNNEAIVKKLMRTVRIFHEYAGEEHLLRPQIKKVDTILSRRDRCLKEGAVYPSCYDSLLKNFKDDFAYLSVTKRPVHGDLNPGNIIIANDGRIYLIDWGEACVENPFLDIGWFACFSGASPEQVHNLLRAYCDREPYKTEVQDTFLFKDFTTLFLATAWIGRQEERDQGKLDALLNTPLTIGSDYIKHGITTTHMTDKKGEEVTRYALGWIKEFIRDQHEDRLCPAQEAA